MADPGPIIAPSKTFFGRIGDVLKNLMTDYKGESLAIGKLFGVVLFGVLVWSDIFIINNVAAGSHTVADWVALMSALSGYNAFGGGTCIALVLGISPQDSANRWFLPKDKADPAAEPQKQDGAAS